jgi:hypothetical protein
MINRGAATVLDCRAYGAYHFRGLFSTGSRRWLAECRRYAALYKTQKVEFAGKGAC